MTLRLHTYSGDASAYKGLIAARYSGVDLVAVEIPRDGLTDERPAFLASRGALSPLVKLPVLELEGGAILCQSNAIARYVARLSGKALLGERPIDSALVEEWIDYARSSVQAPFESWFNPLINVWPYDANKERLAKIAVADSFGLLNTHLESKTFLVGERVSLADIIMVCTIFDAFTRTCESAFLAPFPHLVRYFMTCVKQPPFAAVLGDVSLCKVALRK